MPNNWTARIMKTSLTELSLDSGEKLHDLIPCDQGAGVPVDKEVHPILWEKLKSPTGTHLNFPWEAANHVRLAATDDEVGVVRQSGSIGPTYFADGECNASGVWEVPASLGSTFTIMVELRGDSDNWAIQLNGDASTSWGNRRAISSSDDGLWLTSTYQGGSGEQYVKEDATVATARHIMGFIKTPTTLVTSKYNIETEELLTRTSNLVDDVNNVDLGQNFFSGTKQIIFSRLLFMPGEHQITDGLVEDFIAEVPDMPTKVGSPNPYKIIADKT